MPDSFFDKLNPNNYYPHMEGGSGNNYDLFNKFRSDVLPLLQRNRMPDVGNYMQHGQPQQTRADFHDNAPLRPGYTPPDVNVQYRPAMSDNIGSRMLESPTVNQQSEFAIKNKVADAAISKNENANQIAQQKVDISRDRADVYDFKAHNPGIKIIAPKGGNIKAINSATGALIKDFGPTGTMDEKTRLDLEQTNDLAKISATGKNQETLEETRARHAIELANAKNAMDTGTTTNTSVTGPNGENMGKRTTTTTPNKATAQPKIGDTKTFPNGRKGRYDGKGWVPIQ